MLIRAVLADDHSVVRQGLRVWLEKSGTVQVVGEASNGREAVALAEELLHVGQRKARGRQAPQPRKDLVGRRLQPF